MKRVAVAVALAGLLSAAVPVYAQNAFGLRAGATLHPDQAHFGFQVRPPRLSPRVRVRPSVELGIGDDATILAVNVDLTYEFHGRDVRPWVGAGPGLVVVSRDHPRDGSDLDAGLNLVGGLDWGPDYRYSVEGRLGVGDLPELKFTFGWIF